MSFKENLRAKINLDGLLRKITSTIRETPGQRRLDKGLTQKLLEMTDLEHKKVRDLDLYVRPLEGESMEVLVFDNELPIYHTTVADVALRKSPVWKEIFSIKNIKKVMDDKDVIVSKGKESLNRLYNDALARLDLSYTGDDLALLVEDARRGLEQKSLEQIQESFDLFFTLLHFQPVSLGILEDDIEVFARPKANGGATKTFEYPIFFNDENFLLGLKKGTISPQSDLDLAWVMQYARGEEGADLEGVEVFEFLAVLALKEKP
ncbi:MAG: hypothetical protein JSV14_08595 [Deltaproteobacteria bacterium]|jgi:hypothetical protein|nr:MAG: hypothetical protein JSV14_08595 [Deltaproteobacteria bacterium]